MTLSAIHDMTRPVAAGKQDAKKPVHFGNAGGEAQDSFEHSGKGKEEKGGILGPLLLLAGGIIAIKRGNLPKALESVKGSRLGNILKRIPGAKAIGKRLENIAAKAAEKASQAAQAGAEAAADAAT